MWNLADKNRIEITIFGEQYLVKTSGSPAYLKRLAAQVDERMRDLAERHPQLGTSKIAVLCALNMADELSRAQDPKKRDGGSKRDQTSRDGG